MLTELLFSFRLVFLNFSLSLLFCLQSTNDCLSISNQLYWFNWQILNNCTCLSLRFFRFLASAVFSAALFSAARSCCIPWVWDAILFANCHNQITSSHFKSSYFLAWIWQKSCDQNDFSTNRMWTQAQSKVNWTILEYNYFHNTLGFQISH